MCSEESPNCKWPGRAHEIRLPSVTAVQLACCWKKKCSSCPKDPEIPGSPFRTMTKYGPAWENPKGQKVGFEQLSSLFAETELPRSTSRHPFNIIHRHSALESNCQHKTKTSENPRIELPPKRKNRRANSLTRIVTSYHLVAQIKKGFSPRMKVRVHRKMLLQLGPEIKNRFAGDTRRGLSSNLKA